MRIASRIGLVLAALVWGCSDSEDESAVAQSEHAIAISELMYHPVLEQSFDDHHEFIELHNHGDVAVDLGGFTLRGGVDFAHMAEPKAGLGDQLADGVDHMVGVNGAGCDLGQERLEDEVILFIEQLDMDILATSQSTGQAASDADTGKACTQDDDA